MLFYAYKYEVNLKTITCPVQIMQGTSRKRRWVLQLEAKLYYAGSSTITAFAAGGSLLVLFSLTNFLQAKIPTNV